LSAAHYLPRPSRSRAARLWLVLSKRMTVVALVVTGVAVGLAVAASASAEDSRLITRHGPVIGPRFAGGDRVVWGERLSAGRVVIRSSPMVGGRGRELYRFTAPRRWRDSVTLVGTPLGAVVSAYSFRRPFGDARVVTRFEGAFLLGARGPVVLARRQMGSSACDYRVGCPFGAPVAADGTRVAYPSGAEQGRRQGSRGAGLP
jgi:hypothetical protein